MSASKKSKKSIPETIAVDDDGEDDDNSVQFLHSKVDHAENVKDETLPQPQYLLEMAKSNRAECKRCCQKIGKSELRVGVVIEGEWGLFTKWQHIHCTVFHKSVVEPASLDGYLELSDELKAAIDKRVRDSKNEVDPDRIAVDPSELVRTDWAIAKEPCSDLLLPLLMYQKEGLGWMLHQEQSESCGGILADEMGMGKTVQALSIILENRPLKPILSSMSSSSSSTLQASNQAYEEQHKRWSAMEDKHYKESGSVPAVSTSCSSSSSSSGSTMLRGGTLIVLPTVAIRQWQSEIARFTTPGSLSVLVYHGSERGISSLSNLASYDIVLTSYKIIEIEYRKATAGTKVKCRICDRSFYPEKLRVHRKYFCGVTAQRTEAQSKTQKKLMRVDLTADDDDEEEKENDDNKGKSKLNKKSSPSATQISSKKQSISAKKKATVAQDDDSGNDSDSSEDTIERQKRINKEKKSAKAKTTAAAQSNGKKQSVSAKKKAAVEQDDDSDNDSDSSEDTIERQKRINKEKKSAKAKTTSASQRNGKKQSVSAKKKATVEQDDDSDNDSSEDAIERQKRINKGKKSAKAKTTAAAQSNGKKQSVSAKKKVTVAQDDGSDNDSDSSEDKIERQKRINKEKKSVKAKTTDAAQSNAKKQSVSAKKKAAIADDDDFGSDDEDDDDYEPTSSNSSSDDSDADEDSDYEEEDGLHLGRRKSSSGGKSGGSSARKVKKKRLSPISSSKSSSTRRSSVTNGTGSVSDSDGSDDDEDSIQRQKRLNKSKINQHNHNSSSSSSSVGRSRFPQKRKLADDNDGSENEDDLEVERDIALAIKQAAKLQPKTKSLLHMMSWFRVVLDEAHLIKDRSTSTAKAVFNLVSLHKWCLTGTPLQNRVGELYSLVRFLRIDPHAYYYCKKKGCGCKSLHYRFTKGLCDDCGHSVMLHFCHFNKHILNPIKRSGYIGEGRTAMLKLKEQVLDEILLRRTKTTRADDIQLPPRIVKVSSGHLDVREEDFYQALYTQSQAQFNTYVQSGTVLNNYAHIFDILIRLRQAVDHPYLVIYSDKQMQQQKQQDIAMISSSSSSASQQLLEKAKSNKKKVLGMNNGNKDCPLCSEEVEDGVRADCCKHIFCRLCISDFLETVTPAPVASNDDDCGDNEYGDDASKQNKRKKKADGNTTTKKKKNDSSSLPAKALCPACSKVLTIDLTSSVDQEEDQPAVTSLLSSSSSLVDEECMDEPFSSSSSSALSVWDATKRRRKSILDKVDLHLFQSSTKMEALMQELHNMIERDPGAKALVFSQFVNMLDLLEYRIQLGGIGCVKLLGHMNINERDTTIKKFQNDMSTRVLLISLKAGGMALNLTTANYIFIFDPWWNPAAEYQAIDRTHRIGQTKPIFATRFIVENTIEERILKLQEKKKLVFDGTIGGDSSAMARLTVDDMRFLFQ